MQKYGRFGKFRLYEIDHVSRRCGSSKPTPIRLTVWLWSQKHAKAVEGNTDPTTRQKPPVKNLPRAAGVAGGTEKALEPVAYRRYGGGAGQERLYGKPTTEMALYGEMSPRRYGGEHRR